MVNPLKTHKTIIIQRKETKFYTTTELQYKMRLVFLKSLKTNSGGQIKVIHLKTTKNTVLPTTSLSSVHSSLQRVENKDNIWSRQVIQWILLSQPTPNKTKYTTNIKVSPKAVVQGKAPLPPNHCAPVFTFY